MRTSVSALLGATVLATTVGLAPSSAAVQFPRQPTNLASLVPHGSAARRSWISPDAKRAGRLLYVADGGCSCVLMYRLAGHNQQPLGQLAVNGLQAVAVGNDGSLWAVAETYPTSQIYKFPRGATSPSLTLNDPGLSQDIAVSKGTVYAANWSTASGAGNVVIFPRGKVNPTQTLSDPSIQNAWGLTVDNGGNIFLSAANPGGSDFLGEFKAGGGSYTFSPLGGATYNYLLCTPRLDTAGNLAVRNDFASYGAQNVEIFSPPNWQLTSQFGGPTGSCGLAFGPGDQTVSSAA